MIGRLTISSKTSKPGNRRRALNGERAGCRVVVLLLRRCPWRSFRDRGVVQAVTAVPPWAASYGLDVRTPAGMESLVAVTAVVAEMDDLELYLLILNFRVPMGVFCGMNMLVILIPIFPGRSIISIELLRLQK